MDPAVLREDMMNGLEHALGRAVDGTVGAAMRTVPRHEFVADHPYDNRGGEAEGTRVLAPTAVARLLEALDAEAGDETLVVGAGVGYTAAVLAEIVGDRHVHAVDIDRRVVSLARRNLAEAGYGGVLVDRRNGADGLPEYAPFDRVLVEAAAVRPPRTLLDQLAPDGRLVMPRGGPDQTLVAVRPEGGSERGNGEDSGRPPETDYEVVGEYGPLALGPLLVEGEQRDITRNRTEREDREFADQGYFARTGWEYDWVDWDDHI
jgi:protein-L-isoaspartate(D-aspartate) O-methyltransferase